MTVSGRQGMGLGWGGLPRSASNDLFRQWSGLCRDEGGLRNWTATPVKGLERTNGRSFGCCI